MSMSYCARLGSHSQATAIITVQQQQCFTHLYANFNNWWNLIGFNTQIMSPCNLKGWPTWEKSLHTCCVWGLWNCLCPGPVTTSDHSVANQLTPQGGRSHCTHRNKHAHTRWLQHGVNTTPPMSLSNVLEIPPLFLKSCPVNEKGTEWTEDKD